MDVATKLNDCSKNMPDVQSIGSAAVERQLSTSEIVANGPISTNSNVGQEMMEMELDSDAVMLEVSYPIILAIDKLRRFCYLGTVHAPVYVSKTFDLTVEANFKVLHELCANVSEKEMVECLGSVLNKSNQQSLPRNNEALLVLAIYLVTCIDPKKRTVVRGHFVKFVHSDKDLFLFVEFAKSVQKLLERPAFNRTVRKAVLEWYNHQTVDNLMYFWSMNEGDYAKHYDLLRSCSFKNDTFKPETLAALNVLSSPLKELVNWPDKLEPVAKHKNRIVGIAKLRLEQKFDTALSIIKELKLTYDHVPRRFIKNMKVARFLHSTMTCEQLLESWPTFKRAFRSNRFAFGKYTQHFKKVLNIEPIRLLLQELRLRKHNKKIVKGVVSAKKPSFIQNLYKQSFGCNKALGLRMHITLNLETTYMDKSLNGRFRSIKYIDAVVALAFGYFKSDPQVNVHIWNDFSGDLVGLPWLRTMSVDEAKSCCQNHAVTKIKQTLTDVIDSASIDTQKTYDVFLVVVPCATRGNSYKCSNRLCERLDEYRKKRNINAKFIIISLRMNQASMSYSGLRNENILEICSISEQTPRLINAFAYGKFF